jgi:CheY-like chemotaxis protein
MQEQKDFVVLIVTENPGQLNALAEILQGNGYSIRTASNGLEAFTILEHSPVDLLLLEFQLPLLNGLEVVEQIRKQPSLQKLPIVVLSAGAVEVKQACLREGADYCLGSDWTGSALREIVHKCLTNFEMASTDG